LTNIGANKPERLTFPTEKFDWDAAWEIRDKIEDNNGPALVTGK
jgi:hypothetical protein